MDFEPSFHCLFRRSRFSRADNDEATGQTQNQKEMFAVAAVAFALKHDEKFRAHFFRKICGFKETAEQAPTTIEVQAHHHSDLLIKDRAKSQVFVVEFKVAARLEKEQNPTKEEFFADSGYGRLISKAFEDQGFKRVSYIVLCDSEKFKADERGYLSWTSRKWDDLIDENEKMTGLWGDLWESLGELGVDAFRFHKLKDMKNAQYTKNAVKMHETLKEIASRLKLGTSSKSIGSRGDSAWYGRTVGAGMVRLKGLESRVKPKKGHLVWFGYSCGPSEDVRAFYFYCGSEEAAKETREFVEKCMRDDPAGHLYIDETDNSVYFEDSKSEIGDGEWFESVFKSLIDK